MLFSLTISQSNLSMYTLFSVDIMMFGDLNTHVKSRFLSNIMMLSGFNVCVNSRFSANITIFDYWTAYVSSRFSAGIMIYGDLNACVKSRFCAGIMMFGDLNACVNSRFSVVAAAAVQQSSCHIKWFRNAYSSISVSCYVHCHDAWRDIGIYGPGYTQCLHSVTNVILCIYDQLM